MSEEKKKDALADALAALAAGEHQEETHLEGSGMEMQAEPVEETPTPVAPRRAAPPAPRAGGPPKPVSRTGAPVPKQGPAPTPAQASERKPPAPAGDARGGAAMPAKASVPRSGSAPVPGAPMRPASPNSKVRPAMPGQGGNAQQSRPAPTSAAPPGTPVPAPVAKPPVRPVAAKPPAAKPPAVKAPVAKAPAPPPPPAPAPPPVEEFVVEEVVEPVAQELTPEEQAAMHEAEVAAEAEAVGHVVEDDDNWNMPAPAPESIARRQPRAPQRELASRTVGFKQTMIPILLTMGVMLCGIAGWSWYLGEESPIAEAQWIATVVVGIGIVMLIFGVVTMLQVKAQLAREAGVES